jgi:hypothetical protein
LHFEDFRARVLVDGKAKRALSEGQFVQPATGASWPVSTDQEGLSLEGLSLEPFGFRRDAASCIAGVSDETLVRDPAYAFHTPYVRVRRGPANVTVRITNLRARRGTLVVRIHMLSDEPGSIARLVTSERIQFNRLAQHGGVVHLPFEGFRGVTFAVMGLVPDDTDAAADKIEVLLDRPAEGTEEEGPFVEARNTAFHSDSIRATSAILAMDRPLLAAPASQPYTIEQTREAAFGNWLTRLQAPATQSIMDWERVYVLQVLEQYGMLQAGARGLALDEIDAKLVGVAASFDTSLVISHRPDVDPAPMREALFASDFASASLLSDRLAWASVCLPDLPPDLINFDFAWSRHVCRSLGSVVEASHFVQGSLECLRPGGILIHLLPFNATSNENVPSSARSIFERSDLERLALLLISRGHEVARLRVRPVRSQRVLKEEAPISFGIVIRKGRSPL